MVQCAVRGCRNNSRVKDPAIKYHSFPKKRHYRLKWVQFCERKGYNFQKARMCSTHFSEEQKQKSMMNRLLGLSPKSERTLIANALPNRNSPEQLEEIAAMNKRLGIKPVRKKLLWKPDEDEKQEMKELVSLAKEHNLAPASLPAKNSPDYYVKKYFVLLSSSTTENPSGNENSAPDFNIVSQSPSIQNEKDLSQPKAKSKTAHMIRQGVCNQTSSICRKTPSKIPRMDHPKAEPTDKKSPKKNETSLKCPQAMSCKDTSVEAALVVATPVKAAPVQISPLTLYDFTKVPNLDNWIEISDTVQEVGMSKALFIVQKTQQFQRAVFFTMLNPQPNGAGYAGVSTHSTFNLKGYSTIQLHARAQGSVSDYKIILRHKGLNQDLHPYYEQVFTMPKNEFTTISLPLANFDPYYQGRKLNFLEAEPLDTSRISSFGFQVYGGVYHPKKQSGSSSFEVDWVKAS